MLEKEKALKISVIDDENLIQMQISDDEEIKYLYLNVSEALSVINHLTLALDYINKKNTKHDEEICFECGLY